MYLGRSKHVKILVGFLLLGLSSFGQAGKSHKYQFKGDLSGASSSSSDHSIVINYTIPELSLESIVNNNGSFYRIKVPGHSLTPEPGKPELPVLTRLIDIPEGSRFRIHISEVKSTKLHPSQNNIKGILFPSQPGEIKRIDQQKPDFVMDKDVYSMKGLIKKDTVAIETIGKIRGRKISMLEISPVSYNPRSNLLEVITSMKIEIEFSNGKISFSKSGYPESALFNETLDKGVINYYPSDLITGYSDKPVEMIILTDTTFKKFLEPYFRWKRQKGFKLNILYRGEHMAGVSYQELKESISNIYSSSSSAGNPPEYLLIIGDADKIPYFGTGNVTDLYYGEFDGNGDYLPDMYIGRIPAADTTSVKSVVQKIVEYEKFQFADTNKFHSRALVFAGKDASYETYMNGQVKYAITNYLTPANKINEYHFYYPEGFTKKDSIMKLISKGLSFINYTGHGSSAGWLHVDIKSPDVKNFNNRSMYPFVISNACRTAQFNDTASLGNKMVLATGEGSIGFIGCTNDSYWDEDFAWAVGSGTPGTDPKYSETGLGAYDRLFHTHGELPSEWFITMGQINYAGNLAVSTTSSLRKKYYWETYEVLGDPSIIPVIGTPGTFNVSLPDTLPNGIKSVSYTVDPFAYMAVSHSDTLWDASFASPSGSVVLNLPGVSNDSCLIVLTGQNKKPIIKTIRFSNINKEFINLSGTGINDQSGNNNGKADFGETFYLKLKVSNLGLANSTNLNATVSSTSPWVQIIKSSTIIGTLPGKSEVNLDNNLQVKINDDIPDLGIITIDLTLKDDKAEKKYRIDLTIHAPKLEIINCIVDDSQLGNNNSIADPGENFNLVFQVRNNGSSNTSGQFIIKNKPIELQVLDSDIKSGILQFGEVSDITVAVKLSESAQYGDFISLLSVLDCTPYIASKDFSFRVGKIRENFESATFNIFPWINLSSKPWTINSLNPYEGSLSARSGAISHNASSSLIIRTFFHEPDTLKFYYKVSSEPNYDYLQFKLNDKELLKKSGESPWIKKDIIIPAGFNKMEWLYKKDNSVSQGADAAWVDLIDFSESTRVDFIQRDLEVARIISPIQKDKYGKELVSVKVLNLGRDTLNSFSLAYSVNSRMPIVQNFKTKLIPYDDSVTVNFDKRADMDIGGSYEISVFGYNNDDDYLLNDTIMIRVENPEIKEMVNFYPNPFIDQLNIDINVETSLNVRITLTNTSGKQVYSENHELTEGENNIQVNSRNLSPSLYILNITGPGISRAYPLIKIKN